MTKTRKNVVPCIVKVWPIEIEVYYYKQCQYMDTCAHDDKEIFKFNEIYSHNHHGNVCFDVCLSIGDARLSFLIRNARIVYGDKKYLAKVSERDKVVLEVMLHF